MPALPNTVRERIASSMMLDRAQIEDFIYEEARLADEHRYDDWEALWADEAIYWVPAGSDDYDPNLRTSIIYDNRSRIATRIRQLKTGKRYSQEPPSRMRRLISNVQPQADENGNILVRSNFILTEVRAGTANVWSGQTIHWLRPENGSFKIAHKKVILVDNAEDIPTLSFLI